MATKRTSRIRVRFKEGKHFQAVWQRDLSHGGIFLRTEHMRPLRSQLLVILTMPDGSDFEIRGEVVRTVTPEEATPSNPAGIAVQLTAMTPEMQKQLETYLVDLKRRTLAPRAQPKPAAPPAPIPDDKAILSRLCWLLASGGPQSRGLDAIFGHTAPEARRAILERLRTLLAPDQPPEYMGWSDARAIIRLLGELDERLTTHDEPPSDD